jgi:hypothetical protein
MTNRPEPDFVNFHGTKWDKEQSPQPLRALLVQDHARASRPSPARYRAVYEQMKLCLSCKHWARFHPGHGACVGYTYHGPSHASKCVCAGFSDPEPGRPDQVYTREQIDRMTRPRWEEKKDRIFLLRDGRYGLWDQWSTEDWKAKPGDVFKPWLEPVLEPEPPT